MSLVKCEKENCRPGVETQGPQRTRVHCRTCNLATKWMSHGERGEPALAAWAAGQRGEPEPYTAPAPSVPAA